MSWAVHFSWNYMQTGVFGMNNSGLAQGGFITPLLSGPDWLTGGAFGLEGSWVKSYCKSCCWDTNIDICCKEKSNSKVWI